MDLKKKQAIIGRISTTIADIHHGVPRGFVPHDNGGSRSFNESRKVRPGENSNKDFQILPYSSILEESYDPID